MEEHVESLSTMLVQAEKQLTLTKSALEDSSTARTGFVTSAHSSRGSPIAAAVKIQAIARGYLERETAPLAAVANAVMQAVLCSPVKQRPPKQRPEVDFVPSGGFNFGAS